MANTLTAQQFDFANRHLGVTVLPGGISKEEFLNLGKARQLWEAARQSARDGLGTLERALLEATKDEDYGPDVRASSHRLFAILAVLDTRLSETLDAAIAAKAPSDRARLRQKASEIHLGYAHCLATDPFFDDLDDNPVHKVTVKRDLDAAIAAIGRLIG